MRTFTPKQFGNIFLKKIAENHHNKTNMVIFRK